MTTYRITVKLWDRHFGDGHPVFTRRIDVRRRTEKGDAEAESLLIQAMRDNQPQQTDRSAAAWVEVSDRHGLKILRSYRNERGQWVSAR